MHVLLFNGSPHREGCTYTALSQVKKALEDSGYRVLEVRRRKDWVAFASLRP